MAGASRPLHFRNSWGQYNTSFSSRPLATRPSSGDWLSFLLGGYDEWETLCNSRGLGSDWRLDRRNGFKSIFMNMPSNIRVKKLQIQDQDGKTRIELSTLPDGSPGLMLVDENGKVRVILAIWGSPNKLPSLSFNDKDGNRRIIVTVRSEGVPYMAFADVNNNVMWTAP